MTAKEFDQKFDDGEDITQMLDLSKAKRPFSAQKKVSIDLPIWMIELIDQEASRLGVTPDFSQVRKNHSHDLHYR